MKYQRAVIALSVVMIGLVVGIPGALAAPTVDTVRILFQPVAFARAAR